MKFSRSEHEVTIINGIRIPIMKSKLNYVSIMDSDFDFYFDTKNIYCFITDRYMLNIMLYINKYTSLLSHLKHIQLCTYDCDNLPLKYINNDEIYYITFNSFEPLHNKSVKIRKSLLKQVLNILNLMAHLNIDVTSISLSNLCLYNNKVKISTTYNMRLIDRKQYITKNLARSILKI